MMTRDFAQRTRTRVAEARAVLTRLRETLRQLAKIDKQHAADRTRLYDKLGEIADDVVEKLPEEATEFDVDRAYTIQEEINGLASEVDEVSLAGSAIEDLNAQLGDAIKDIYESLKVAEIQLAKVDRLGTKLGV